ncbi:McrA Restriction endonuclease [uncultured Caudovirales phage]|uniref:McrA Restriction endonuclease n=1 Tax=uncultured Caudovirales phage TaxID=2100421 RepID=A0A6J5TDH5_9CAUD|nr:McrA Restriction endonuclease [uncultured Caudovirales phage]
MILEHQYPALLLNADWQPVQMHPLSTISWQDAIKAVVSDRVTVVSEYDVEIHSGTKAWKLPSVLALKDYVNRDQRPTFSRYNVFMRDKFTCQYCGGEFETRQLTFDHVIPRAAGGISSWTNVVAACSPCNHRKGSKLPKEIGMFPINTPKAPSAWDLYAQAKRIPHKNLHESWRDYLYWDTELEES